jgi:hypothetical protein
MPLPHRPSLLQLHSSCDADNADVYVHDPSIDSFILPTPIVEGKKKSRERKPPAGVYKAKFLLVPIEYLRISSSLHSRGTLSASPSLTSETSSHHPSFMLNVSSLYKSKNTKLLWLSAYFFFNLGLTLYNKAVLVHFPFPYTVTAIHALCGTLGGNMLLRQGVYVPAKLDDSKNIILYAFSGLYAINIVVSNVSLHLVSVPVRSLFCITLIMLV